ncbi:MAG: glucosamine-6-phosphate deaminase [Bacteriovoracaceae bacterium]|jgi:glucosamine-6-phosphate deaminase
MEIKVFNTASEVSDYVARQILELVQKKPDSSLGVATGRTMDAIYHKLIKLAVNEKTSFNQVRAFAVDEYIGLAEGSMNSYKEYLNLHLFDQLDFKKDNLYIPETVLEKIDESCKKYEEQILAQGGIDLQLLGVGLNGHIGLNEPGSSTDSRTRIVGLTSTTRNSNKVLFRNETIPATAVTMGIGTILESKQCMLIATGETKSEIVQKVVNGDINSKVPATALKQHKNCIIILDKEAAKLI